MSTVLSREDIARRILQLPPDQQSEAAQAALALYGPARISDQARTVLKPEISLVEFSQQAWHVVEPARRYVDGFHIHATCEHLEAVSLGQIRKLLINMPPRHMKSLLVAVFWFAWSWTFMPWTRWLYASYAEKLSKRDSLKSRRLIMSPWYQERWGHLVTISSDQNEKLKFENTALGYRIATSVGGTGTGEGGDFVVWDDPHKAGEAHSETIREGVLTWADEEWSTRGNDPERSVFVGVMQRLHEQDLSGHVLERGDWEHLCLPAEFEPNHPYIFKPDGTRRVTSIGWTDPRTEDRQLLWPERFTRPALESLKATLGSYGTAGQLQQRPAPAEGGILQREWFRFWVPANSNLPPVRFQRADGSWHTHVQMPLPFKRQKAAHSWDMTFKDTVDSAYVVGQHWEQLDADLFLIDQVRRKMDFPTTLKAVAAFAEDHPNAAAKWVEDKANGPAVIATLKRTIPGLIAVNPEGDKIARAHAVSPYIESGNVYLPHPAIADWVMPLIVEVTLFPNSVYKDQVDTMTQAISRMMKARGRVGNPDDWATFKR